jgi:hypothetical protein
MPRAFGNAIAEIVAAPGTGAFSLGTAAPGCKLFATAIEADGTAIANGDTVKCAAFAIDANGNPTGGREIGIYTFNTGTPNTLTRSTIIESSNGGAAVNFTGNVRVELIGFVATDVTAMELPAFGGQALPATPAEGQRLFSRSRAGRDILAVRDALGAVREVMPQFGSVSSRFAVPVPNVAAPSAFGLSMSAYGTNTARVISATPLFLSSVRVGNVSAATAGSAGGWRSGSSHALRGGAAGLGGFYRLCRFGVSAFTSDCRGFVGLAVAGSIGNVDPSTLASTIGVGWDSADSNLQIIANDATGLATKIDLGANFPAKTANTDLYEVRLWCAPNGASIGWSVERLNTGNFASGTITASGDLPAATTLLADQVWINNGASASAVGIDLAALYVETPV